MSIRKLDRVPLCILVFMFYCTLGCAQWAPDVRRPKGRAEDRLVARRALRNVLALGVYSISGRGEWVQWNEQIPVGDYAKLANEFYADNFDANAWAELAKQGGMKYAVLTARHHDGFALFDDPGSSFTAVKSAAHRDFVADYVQAVRKAGLRVGLYYSPLDWRFPGFFFPGMTARMPKSFATNTNVRLVKLASR